MRKSPKLRTRNPAALLLGSCALLGSGTVVAGEADVLAVDVECKAPVKPRPASICRFSVTVQHADTGWKHYANRYDVLDVNGPLIASRTLRHPHVDEQPFTRELGPLAIRHEVEKVRVRAHDLEHGIGGAEVIVEIPHERAEAGERAPEP
jgi:hypothetical protein